MTLQKAACSPREFRDTMGHFATGVAVVTTATGGRRFGMPVNSLTSVSLTPQIVSVSFKEGSVTASALLARGEFAVNILGTHQEQLVPKFMSQSDDRFSGVLLSPHASDLPVIDGCLGHLICAVRAKTTVGDHVVVFGEVVECVSRQGDPLVFHRGQYARISPSIQRTLQ